jgi:hypothetical protein
MFTFTGMPLNYQTLRELRTRQSYENGPGWYTVRTISNEKGPWEEPVPFDESIYGGWELTVPRYALGRMRIYTNHEKGIRFVVEDEFRIADRAYSEPR